RRWLGFRRRRLRRDLGLARLDRFVRRGGGLLGWVGREELLEGLDRLLALAELHVHLTDRVEQVGLRVERVRRLELRERHVVLLRLMRLGRLLDVLLRLSLLLAAGGCDEWERDERDDKQMLHWRHFLFGKRESGSHADFL